MGKGTWATADVPEMWISAQAADTNMAWEQVGAWSRTYELLTYHEQRLRVLQNELSTAWPPSRSPAAAAFVSHIDGLLAKISRARQDAASNRDALRLLLEALASAKKDMAPLKAKWDRYEVEATRSPLGRHSMAHPAPGAWQQELNAEARARMTQSDRDVFEAAQRMAVLDPDRIERDEGDKSEGLAQSGSISHREAIGSSSIAGPTTVFTDSVNPLSTGQPELAGTAVVVPSSPTSPPPIAAPLPTGTDATPARGPQSFAPVHGIASGAGPVRQSATGRLPNGASARSSSISSVSGTPPAMGVGGQRAASRVNPVGGVISPSPMGMAGVPPARVGGAGGADENTRAPVPMVQWEVAHGGVPVIEPPVERPFELGPGVIGIDR